MSTQTNWASLKPIPTENLEAWHQVESGSSTSTFAPDFSGKGRHLTVGAGNSPVLGPTTLNGESGYYFNGSRDPLVWSGGSILTTHVFIIMAFEKAAFSGFEGVVSGVNQGDILVANDSGSNFYNFGASEEYRKSDVPYVSSNMQAPMAGGFALVEMTVSGGGWSMDGLQIGKQRSSFARLLQGWYMGSMIYSAIQTGHKRVAILEYVAARFQLWPKVASGLNVFPFQPDWSGNLPASKLILESTAVSGKTKSRSKSTAKREFDLGFSTRRAEEYDATFAFWNSHYPGQPFIYRDYGFDPSRDTEVTIISDLDAQRNSYHDINYAFRVRQT